MAGYFHRYALRHTSVDHPSDGGASEIMTHASRYACKATSWAPSAGKVFDPLSLVVTFHVNEQVRRHTLGVALPFVRCRRASNVGMCLPLFL
jgi:hypothetical protein